MSEPIRISVVTPSFNQGAFIGRTLASVAQQSYPAHEHLVFDGGSSDDTLNVLRAAGENVHWNSGPDGGQADAVNKGIQAASGDVIAWINSDDVYYPGAFAKVAAAFAEDPMLDVVYGGADHIDVNDHPFEAYPTTFWDPELLRHTCFICQPALFFRRRVVERVGLLDAGLRYCMDYNYWLRMADAGCKFAYLPEKLAGSRLYAENKTLSERPAVHWEIAEMLLASYGTVSLRWVFAYAHKRTEACIDRSVHPMQFKIHLYLTTMRSQIRWNHRVGISALRELRRVRRRHALQPTQAGEEAASS